MGLLQSEGLGAERIFLSFVRFYFEGELLLTKEAERNVVSCSHRGHSYKWWATASVETRPNSK